MIDLSCLNASQRAVATELNRNILLMASAGTGKTNTLSYRIANIIDQGLAEADEILCLTFTNKACNEMRQRIISCVREAGLKVVVRTVHSFCYDVVKAEAKKHSDLFTDFIIFDEEDCKEIIRGIDGWDIPEKNLQSFIDTIKHYRAIFDIYSEDEKADYAETIKRFTKENLARLEEICRGPGYEIVDDWLKSLCSHGEELLQSYNGQLREMHGLDFSDLILKTYEFFKDETIRTLWQNRFKYINIDEVQDTSVFEYHTLSRIFPGNNILLCGDYFQTVYEWRGSQPSTVISHFQADWNPRYIRFNENYRSTQTLLQASAECLKNLFGSEKVTAIYDQKFQAISKAKGKEITVKSAYTIVDEARWINRKIHEIRDLTGAGLTDFCILTRDNKYNSRLSKHLQEMNESLPREKRLRFMLVDEIKLMRRQEIKDVLAFAKLVLNRHDTTSLSRILKRYAAGIGEGTIKAIGSDEYKKAGLRLADYVDPLTRRDGDPYACLLEEMENKQVIVFDVESTGTDPLTDEIIQIAAVRLDATGQPCQSFQRFLKLKSKDTVGDSALIHHFTDTYLAAHGEQPETVLKDFTNFIDGAVLVGHNVTYDLSILASYLDRLGLPQAHYKTYYDTLDIYRRFYPNLPNHKLEFLGQHFQVGHRSSHDADDDIRATAELLWYAIEQHLRPGLKRRQELITKHLAKFEPLAQKIDGLRTKAQVLRPHELLAAIIKSAAIDDYYHKKGEEQRIDYLREFYVNLKYKDDPAQSPQDALKSTLKTSALSNTELDNVLDKYPKIPIITVHQAKGSEFDYVFLAGLQEGTFPSWISLKKDNMDEEKRLFYVAITRAKKELYISWNERERHLGPSHFINAIPAAFRQYE